MLTALRLAAQDPFVFLQGIDLQGHKQTRPEVILRELPFAAGDTLALSSLPSLLTEAENQLMNTGLFTRADVTYSAWEGETNRIRLLVSVEEDWYIYPVPVFELADRNFNVWWTEQNRSLQRINFGLVFTHQNLSGWNDKLKVGAEFGYTNKYSLRYSLPYLNRARTLGVSAGVNFSRNREVNYLTRDNKQIFFRDPDDFLYERLRADVALELRPALYTTHEWGLGFRHNTIDSVIAQQYNSEFFGEGRMQQRFFRLVYRLQTDRRDVRAYPWSGYYLHAELEKSGLGIWQDRNALTLEGSLRRYLPFGSRWSLALTAVGKYSIIRSAQPYNDVRALGFGDFTISGYEFYIVDGLDVGVLKSSLRYRLFETGINFGKLVPIAAFRRMPVKAFTVINGDTGYANHPHLQGNNPLTNRWLYGAGLGFDLVLYYDKVVRFEYNVNHRGEHGFFVKLDLNI